MITIVTSTTIIALLAAMMRPNIYNNNNKIDTIMILDIKEIALAITNQQNTTRTPGTISMITLEIPTINVAPTKIDKVTHTITHYHEMKTANITMSNSRTRIL